MTTKTQIRTLKFSIQVCTLTLVVMLLCATWASAQSTYGTITGTVTDSSGAVVTGAKVEIRNQETGTTRYVLTGAQGYRFANVDPGIYTVKASMLNFGTLENRDVVLQARDVVVVNLQLKVESKGEEITVTSGQEIVSQDLTESTSVSGTEISSLPLNFRATNAPSPIEAATLTPGVDQDQSGNLTFSGQLPTATSFSLDGISIQSVRVGGPSKDLFPSVEGIAEFRVNTAANSAEFAQPTDLTVVSKSGTDEFHGSAFGYFGRQAWNAADPIAKFNPTLDANTFGASIGGPIRKNKVFFYFDYEGVRLDQNSLVATQTIAPQWLTGNFSSVGGGAVPFVLTNPTTGTPYTNLAQLPINPTSSQLAATFLPPAAGPAANDNNIDVSGANNLNTIVPGHYSSDGYDGRLDYNFSANHHIFGRVTQHTIDSTGTDATQAGALGAVGDTSYNPTMGTFATQTNATNVAISYNWIIRPTLVNELRGGYTRYNLSYSFPQALLPYNTTSSLVAGLPGPPVNGLGGVPAFYIGSLLGGSSNQFGHPRHQKNGIWETDDILQWGHGKFNSKFGAGFRRLNYEDNITFLTGDEYGDYTIGGGQVCATAVLAAYPEACASAQFMLGYLDEAAQAQNGPDGKPYGYHYHFFGQTEWKARPNLMLTVGLRYEINTPFQDATNQLGQFDYFKNSPFYGKLIYDTGEKLSPAWVKAVGGQSQFVLNTAVGLPPALRFVDKTNFQPRLGLTWNPSPNTVVRAAGGVYSVPVLGAVLYSLLGVDTSNFGSFFPTGGPGSMTWSNAFLGGAAGVVCPPSCPGYRRANQWHLQDPRVIQWNFGVEQNIGFRSVFKASYIGSHTYNLVYSPDLNQIPPNTLGYAAYRATFGVNFPNFREVLTRADGPSDRYEALILELNRRFGRGLTFNNSYTLNWNKTNALGTVPSSAIPSGGQGDNGNNVANIFNIAADTGNAYYDPRQQFLSTVEYELPFGRGKQFLNSSSRAMDLVVGGWNINGIIRYHSGFWLTPSFPSSFADPSGTAPQNRSVSSQRPDCISGASGYLPNPTIADYFNASAFSVPASDIGRFGNCGVGILEGPDTATFSTAVGKTFLVTERFRVQYQALFANIFNIINWGQPNMNVTSSSFGKITSAQDSAPASMAGPRSIQMSLRLQF
jgi:hypothetical protein